MDARVLRAARSAEKCRFINPLGCKFGMSSGRPRGGFWLVRGQIHCAWERQNRAATVLVRLDRSLLLRQQACAGAI